MKRISFWFIGGLLSCSSVLNAQQIAGQKIRFSGVTLNSQTTHPVTGVSCRSGEWVSTTDAQGRFAVNTMAGDTIYFTHVGFQPYQVIVPDTLSTEEYILAIFMSAVTVVLPEVMVVHRFKAQTRQYQLNARNNMAGVRQEAFSSSPEFTQQQNQKRVLDEYAAGTNKGHVKVGLGVGVESYEVLRNMITARKIKNEPPALLRREEMDLVKMLYSLKHSFSPERKTAAPAEHQPESGVK